MTLLSKIIKTVGIAIAFTMTAGQKAITMRTLVLTTEGMASDAITMNLQSYGIPYDVIEFKPSDPFQGQLSLYDENEQPKYNLVVVNGGELSYEVNGSWVSALNNKQWSYLEDYESKNSVRRVIISDEISEKTDVVLEDESVWGDTLEVQPLMVEKSDEVKKIFNDAGVKITAPLDVNDIYHSRIKITNTKTTKPFLYYDDDGKQGAVAATIAKYDDGREVMSFFFELGTWHQSSSVINHLWLTWGTRSLFNGFRRVYFTPHIDDVFLATEVFDTSFGGINVNNVYRTTQSDYEKIAQFQKDILKDMPEGSFFRSELAFNGNGILINADYRYAVEIDTETNVVEEYIVEPGTGESRWPRKYYQLSAAQINALKDDDLFSYFSHNETAQKEFFWSSHTFTHLNLNDASKEDVDNEIRLNIDIAEYLGLTDKEYWSGHSIISPQISGLHNKDALEVFEQYGIQSATGDISRDAITNLENPYLPFFTTNESSNKEGYPIIPRTPTEIYFFCSRREENIYVYNIYYDVDDIDQFFQNEGERTFLLMAQLRHEAHQFHQVNLRYYPKEGNYGESLLEDWTRAVLNVYNKYFEWPLISIKLDQQAENYLERAKLETCGQETKLLIENNKVVGVSVSATKGDCKVPVTIPTGVNKSSLPEDATLEQIGKDPLTVWVPVKKGETKSFKFDKPVDWIVSDSEVEVNSTTVVESTTTTVVEPTTTVVEPTTTVVEPTTTVVESTTVVAEPTTTEVEPSTTTVVEPTTNYQCLAETIGYPCCSPRVTEVYFSDNHGDWGFDFVTSEWCGLTPYKDEKKDECWSEKFGYKCCSGCRVRYEDEDGKWGYESDWCGIVEDSCN